MQEAPGQRISGAPATGPSPLGCSGKPSKSHLRGEGIGYREARRADDAAGRSQSKQIAAADRGQSPADGGNGVDWNAWKAGLEAELDDAEQKLMAQIDKVKQARTAIAAL